MSTVKNKYRRLTKYDGMKILNEAKSVEINPENKLSPQD